MVTAELRKLLALPTAWAGLAIGTLLAPLIVLINARYTHAALVDGTYGDVADLGLMDLGIGLIGPMVLASCRSAANTPPPASTPPASPSSTPR